MVFNKQERREDMNAIILIGHALLLFLNTVDTRYLFITLLNIIIIIIVTV